MSGGYNNQRIDTINEAYVAGNRTVGTTETIINATGGANLADRQNLVIYNRSTTTTIYVGPTGITTSVGSIPIPPGAVATFNAGAQIDMYMIADTAGNTVTVQEFS